MDLSEALIQRQERPTSPCTKVCKLDAQGYCLGCLRTGTEIAEWMSMTPAEQWKLIDQLAQRRERLAGEAAGRLSASRERG